MAQKRRVQPAPMPIAQPGVIDLASGGLAMGRVVLDTHEHRMPPDATAALERSMQRPGAFGGAASFTVGPKPPEPPPQLALPVLALLDKAADQATKVGNYVAAHALHTAAIRLAEFRNVADDAMSHCDGALLAALGKIARAL